VRVIAGMAALAPAVAVITVARRRGWGWMAPMNLYAAAWTAAIFLYTLRFFPFYDLQSETWILLGGAAAAFVGASFLSERVRPRQPRHERRPETRSLQRVADVFLALGLCGTALFLYRVNAYVGLDAFFRSPIVVHSALTERKIDPSYLFLYYFAVAGAILYGYAIFVRRARPRVLEVLLLLAAVAGMVVSTERTQFLWVVASWFFFACVPPEGDRRLWRIIGTGVAALLVAGTFYLGVGLWLGKSPDNIATALEQRAESEAEPLSDSSQARLSLLLPGGVLHHVSVLYMAVASPLPAFDRVVDSRPELTAGRHTFHPVWRTLGRLGLVSATGGTIYPEVETPYPANAYTYLYEFFLDFGWPGVLVLPLALGLLCGYAYQRVAKGSDADVWVLPLAQLQVMVLWTPFANRFVTTVNWYLLALLVMGFVAARRLDRWTAADA
jgi:hypothetical protein